MELDNVQINPAEGPAFLIRNSTELTMRAAERRVPGAAPVIRLDDCAGAIIRGSRSWPGTTLFLSEKAGAQDKAALDTGTRAESMEDFWKK